MTTLEARGVEIAWSTRGEGRPIVLIHETAATSAVWLPVAEALADKAQALLYDRRGWGDSTAPEDYRRTTVEEQSEDAATLIEAVADSPAVACGAGSGAVIALDLLLRRADVVSGAVLIEPPLFQLLPIATEALSEDRRRIEIATGAGEDVIELYLSGALTALGPGVSRIPDEIAAEARAHPASLIAELGLAARWRMPLPRLAGAERPSVIVTALSTPPILRDAAAALADRMSGASLREVDSGEEAPEIGAAEEIAALTLEISP
jgi:pimeloyl-ACP methyl ester carboxylesterase